MTSAVDIRQGISDVWQMGGVALSAENKRMLYVPPGFAHGFCVISEDAEIHYMTTEEYAPDFESGVIWNDPRFSIRLADR